MALLVLCTSLTEPAPIPVRERHCRLFCGGSMDHHSIGTASRTYTHSYKLKSKCLYSWKVAVLWIQKTGWQRDLEDDVTSGEPPTAGTVFFSTENPGITTACCSASLTIVGQKSRDLRTSVVLPAVNDYLKVSFSVRRRTSCRYCTAKTVWVIFPGLGPASPISCFRLPLPPCPAPLCWAKEGAEGMNHPEISRSTRRSSILP